MQRSIPNENKKKLATVICIFKNTQNLVILHCRFAEDSKEMYEDL